MSSNIEIRRICAWCKQEFIAHKTTTTCCSHRCANLLYKQKKRESSIKANNQIIEKVIKEKPIEKIRDKPILTITEAATYIGVTRPTLYGYLKRGELKASRLGYKFLLKMLVGRNLRLQCRYHLPDLFHLFREITYRLRQLIKSDLFVCHTYSFLIVRWQRKLVF